MKKLLYPLIASALITIIPFLLTFEKGQDIVRGLFGYEYFALLLFIVYVKEKIFRAKKTLRATKVAWHSLCLLALIILLVIVAWFDLQNLLAIKGWNTGLYVILPCVTCGLAIAMLWHIPTFSLINISFVLFVTLIIHLAAYNCFPSQPLAQFSVIDYLASTAPQPPQRKEIDIAFKDKYIVTDSASITRNYVDTTRSNVIILVESWGVPLDINRFEKQQKSFDEPIVATGIHHRMYSRTKTAEREDLIYEIHRDSNGHRDTTFLPQIFTKKNYKTTFLFGGDSLEHYRYKYIANIGFSEAIYGHNQDDATMAFKIDSLLTDTTQKHFIAWTTRDTKFPMIDFPDIYNSNTDAIDSVFSYRLGQTLSLLANLAKRHPDARFIIQGDHNPILSPIEFQERFYKRWVPYIILN